MMRSYVGLLLVTLVGLYAAPAAASGNAIAGAMGNLRWGMNEREVRTALEGKLSKADARELNSSYVEFDGKKTRWDHSDVAEEYTHGNEESMLSYKDRDGSSNYYFFIGGQLWKWVKLYPASAFGGSDFSRFSKKVRARFGKGYEKDGEVNPGSGAKYKFLEFLNRNTRLRAVDKTDEHHEYALMFEAMDTVRSLAALRSNTIRRYKAPSRSRAVASSDAEPTRALAPVHAGAIASKETGKRSIFGNGQHAETREEYIARKQRAEQEAREKQRHIYERSQESKKGKILDSLAGLDDSDPIAGAAK